jgi:hypothetical protein
MELIMSPKYVKIKNNTTGLFWYGFGEPNNIPNKVNLKEEQLDDKEEPECTWFDLNIEREKQYIENNFNDLKHSYVYVSEHEKNIMQKNLKINS